MKFLVDTSPATLAKRESELIGGQLLTPLTNYKNAGVVFGIDNGAYSSFNAKSFKSLLSRNEKHKHNCLFVSCPDIVGSHARTIELWRYRHEWIPIGWPLAFVAQDGAEVGEIPWDEMSAVFIGGCDPWKDSKHAQNIVKTATILGKHKHIGRVNTVKRFRLFSELGADTCDGSGIAMYDHMLETIEQSLMAPNVKRGLFAQATNK